ncbi:MAG: indolepyruvate ferredoxin oxidoreductase family protein, partial [Hyphomicrobiales bacterium]|nr:indolepyruvate ferredoxin oxidoreductase family protein [Hyphomicrobiales bacterium]
FAEGLEKIFVVEERRSFLESQLKEIAYHWPVDKRPEILGKTDRSGKPLFPSIGETSPQLVAEIIGKYLLKDTDRPEIVAGMRALTVRKDAILQPAAIAGRIPHFCAGCPHSRSTELTQGSTALAGIGCHSLAIWMDAGDTRLLTQMGGEGANWIGAHRYVDMPHVFQNLGDGTYTHSGLLAIRAAVAANAPITYRILYNDAVAMTGGQPLEGALGVGDIARQMQAEKVGKVVVVSGELESLQSHDLPVGIPLHHRDELTAVMEDCRSWPGVSVI